MYKYFFLLNLMMFFSCINNSVNDKQVENYINTNECAIDYSLIDSVKYYNHLGIISHLNQGKEINGKFYTMFLFELDSNQNNNEFNLTNHVLYELLKTQKNIININSIAVTRHNSLISHLKSLDCKDYNQKEIYSLIKNNVTVDTNFIELKNEILLQYDI